MREKIHKVEVLKEELRKGGGFEEIEKQHQKGKLTARERIERFLDPDTFEEIELLTLPIYTGFESDKKSIRGDGLVSGYGRVNGRPVCVWAQDATVNGGRMGVIHGKKIVTLMERALKAGIPCIGIVDSEGVRVEEAISTPTKYSYDRIMYTQTLASGVIPQIILVMGPCLGGQALSAQLADFIFMVQNTGYMSIGSDSGASLQEIGNAKIHSRFSGSCDVVCRDDEECLQKVRELISILPLNNNEKAPFVETGDDPEREVAELLDLVPTNSIKSYSMYQVISLIVDQGYFFEIKHYWATNLIVGFARLGGQTVGMLANNPQSKGGCMDVDSADKMAHFVRFCDAFNIPLIWLADTPAFLPGVDQETRGIIRHGSKVPFHNTMFSVPGLTVYLRKCYGGGNLAMPGNNMAGDIGIEWPTSEIFLMNPEGAAAIIHRKEIEASENPEEELSRRAVEFREGGQTISWVVVQDTINPKDTRKKLIRYLKYVENKKVYCCWRKHDNVPL